MAATSIVFRRPAQSIVVGGNLAGAVVAFCYFRFIDTGSNQTRVGAFEIVFSIVAFSILAFVGTWISRSWSRPLGPWLREEIAPEPAPASIRRRALLVPFAYAVHTVVGWIIAGLVWGTLWDVIAGRFSLVRSVRLFFGITVIGGGVTSAFIFFAIEHVWRRFLPRFFPDGDLSAVSGTPRFPVRTRLLAIFLLVGVVPLTLLAVVSYTSALSLLGADPATARGIVDELRMITLSLLAIGLVAAVGLSVFAANSVAHPLKHLEAAMVEVGRGNLERRATVVSTDEIGTVTEGFNRMLHGLREREIVKETFGKYVTPEVRDEILAGRVRGEGELTEATILFADLRDFTPWVEATEPRQVVRDLNEYFTEMDGAIRAHRGLVLQFIGDEIEAVFGAPIRAGDHAEMAVRAALEMRTRLRAWNVRREAGGQTPLRHGIGIHTGTVLAGNIGGAERLSYALVGDPVNLASRIQGLTKDFKVDILISEATRSRLNGGIRVEELPAVHVKGRADDVNVFKVV
jgi:adenylate cyclase